MRWLLNPIRIILCFGVATSLFTGCGTIAPTLTPTIALTASEELAIYQILLEQFRPGENKSIDLITNHGFLDVGSHNARDCAGLQAWLTQDMPDIIPDIIPAFCMTTEEPRPINPEVVRMLELENVDVRDRSGFRVSAIQTDPNHKQALVFIEVYGGDFLTMYYVLLLQDEGTWKIRYQVQ